MTISEKRELLVKNALSRERKNQYSQDPNKRLLIEKGYGDCSGTVFYWYKKLFDINIGGNTEAQLNSKLGTRINLNIKNGIPDETLLKKGDLLYFRGSDNSRTEGVGHVEMYIGDGKCFGHGSGIGGTVKNLESYCKLRYNTKSTSKLKNKGLICAMRFILDDTTNSTENKIKEEDKPMTTEERKEFEILKKKVATLEENQKVYHYTAELPVYPDGTGRATVQKLLDRGVFAGASPSDLNLPATMFRIMVINDRAGVYK